MIQNLDRQNSIFAVIFVIQNLDWHDTTLTIMKEDTLAFFIQIMKILQLNMILNLITMLNLLTKRCRTLPLHFYLRLC